ncbi:MAG: hypothetical protein ABIN25_00035 [Ginsengibacter sp.]
MKNAGKNVIFIFTFLYINACYTPRYVYSPPTQNIPGLNRKNDIELAANYGSSLNIFPRKNNYSRGFDLHTAWAFSKHFGIMLNENARWERNTTNDSFFPADSSSLSYKRNFTEAGIGYFTPLRNNTKMQFQVFSGAAFGSSGIWDDFFSNGSYTKKYHQSAVTKIFIQPAFIFIPTKDFAAALSSRFTKVSFSNIRTNYTASEQNNYLLDSLTVHPIFFWEPALTYTFGFKKFPVKVRLQGSISVLLNHRFVEHRSSNIGLGLVSDFSPHHSKLKEVPKN